MSSPVSSTAWSVQAQQIAQASLARRRQTSRAMVSLLAVSALLAVAPLVAVVAHLVRSGVGALSLAFFTEMPSPVGDVGGGIANAFAGSTLVVSMALVLGLPLGLGAGIYLAERPRTRLASISRYLADVLNGTPSIVVGIAAWAAVVRPMGRFSAFAGSVALAVILVPLVARATEEMVRLVPSALRQAALALGFSEWRAAVRVVIPAAWPGIITGILVAIARVAGETAPLLFTAFGNQFWSLSPGQPIATVPLQLYIGAVSPYDHTRQQAWGAALVLVSAVALLTWIGRTVAGQRLRRGR